MTTAAAISASPTARQLSTRPSPRALRILALELRNELLQLVRTPGFVLPALGFPWVFYLLFGLALPMPRSGSTSMSGYLLATYGVFSVLGVSLFSLGANAAVERGRGWTTARRAMPASGLLHIAARLLVVMLMGGVAVLGLMVLAGSFGGVRLPTTGWLVLLLTQVALAIPFGALGLALGHVLSAEAAHGVTNLIYLPMSLLSGLWIPVQMLPAPLQAVAQWLPPYHGARLALRQLGVGLDSPPWVSVLHLAILAIVAFGVAAWAMPLQGGAKG